MRRPREHLFSAKFACPICNYSLAGARAAALLVQQSDGRVPALRRSGLDQLLRSEARRRVSAALARLGRDQGLGPAQPVLFPDAAGASRSTSGFDLERPFARLPERVQQLVLYGSGDEKIPFTYLSERGKPMVREHAFEGIIPNLERRYRETDSVMVREELAKYLNSKPCPECGGTRLRREARFVKVGDGRRRARDLRGVGARRSRRRRPISRR